MRGFWQLTWTELKLFLREPVATFFTLVFPLMMLFLFGSIYGNNPTPFFGGYGSVDVMVPSYMAMVMANTGLMGLAITIAAYRESGILHRLRATPLRPHAVLMAQLSVLVLMTAAGLLLLLVAGKVFYRLRFDGDALAVFAALILSCASLFSLGFVLAASLPNARTTQIVAMALFYPMIFLSGATLPREILPANVRQVAEFLPLTHVVTLLRGLWTGNAWATYVREVLILTGIFAVSFVLSARTFRWE